MGSGDILPGAPRPQGFDYSFYLCHFLGFVDADASFEGCDHVVSQEKEKADLYFAIKVQNSMFHSCDTDPW